jgi:CBS domain-containing protein
VKEQDVVCLRPEATVRDAARLMTERRIGAIVVVEGGILRGIFTERDLTSRVIAAGKDPATTHLSEAMSRDPTTLPPTASAFEALQLMQSKRFRHLPVVAEDGAVVSMVSIRDLYDVVKDHLEKRLEETEAYVFSSGYSASVLPQPVETTGWA